MVQHQNTAQTVEQQHEQNQPAKGAESVMRHRYDDLANIMSTKAHGQQIAEMEIRMLERYHQMHQDLSADRMQMPPSELDRLISIYNRDVSRYSGAVLQHTAARLHALGGLGCLFGASPDHPRPSSSPIGPQLEPCIELTAKPPSSDVRRVGSYSRGRHANVVTALLSSKEAAELCRVIAGVGYRAVIPEISQNLSQTLTRTHKLCLLRDASLASWLWQRLLRCEPAVVPADMQDGESRWVPVGIHPLIKFNEYEAGQVFGPHTDAVFESYTANERTFMTVLVYLNDGFEGGHTNFLRSRRGPVEMGVAPVCGNGMVFQHDMLHEATEPTGSPSKMIMQADILFRRAKSF